MRRRETLRNLHRNIDGLPETGFRSAQRFAIHQFADDVTFTDVVYGHNIRVIERRHDTRFLFESLAARRIAGQFGRQDLQRHIASEPGVSRPIDFAHAARAERSNNLVRAKSSSSSKRHIYCFKPDAQFSTVTIGELAAPSTSVNTKNFWPSPVAT